MNFTCADMDPANTSTSSAGSFPFSKWMTVESESESSGKNASSKTQTQNEASSGGSPLKADGVNDDHSDDKIPYFGVTDAEGVDRLEC
jgi:hypothetical protein